jgi:hypothetical protein
VEVGSRRLAVEVTVAHPLDARRMDRYLSQGLSVIEIDLARCARDLSRDEIAEMVVGPGPHKRWAFNVRAAQLRRKVWARATSRPKVSRGYGPQVANCPLRVRSGARNAFANIVKDCNACEHCLEVGSLGAYVECAG